MSNMPKVRFAGYTQEWEKHKLSEVFDYLKNNTLSRAELSLENGVARNVHYGDVLIKFPEYLDVSKSALPFIESEQIAEKFKDSSLQDGDVVMADTAEDATVGKCSEIAGIDGFPTVSGLHTIPMRPKGKYAPGYLGYYMNSDAYHKQLIPLMQGIKVSSVSKSAIKKTSIVSPPEQAEQAGVGKLFIQLEYLISFNQQEYEKLVSLKSAFMDKMFPKDGNKVPVLRFTKFNGEWRKTELGNLGTLRNGMNFPKEAMGTGYPFVNLQDVFGKNVIDINNLGKAQATEEQLRDYNLKEGDVLFVRSSVKLEGVGEAALVPKTLENTTYSGFIIRFRDEYGMENNFKRFLFSSSYIRRQILSQATDSANKNISQKALLGLKIMLPKAEEQKAIGRLFDRLDCMINLQRYRMEKLKQFKQALLHNMFV